MILDAFLVAHAWMFWLAFRWVTRALVPGIGWAPNVSGALVSVAFFFLTGSPAVLLFGIWDLAHLLRGYVAGSRLVRDPQEAALLRAVRDPDELMRLVIGLLGRAPAGLGGGGGGLLAGSRIVLPPPLDFENDHAGFRNLLLRMMPRYPAEAGLVSQVYTAGEKDAEMVARMLVGHVTAVVAPRLLRNVLLASFVSLLGGVMVIFAFFIMDRLSQFGF